MIIRIEAEWSETISDEDRVYVSRVVLELDEDQVRSLLMGSGEKSKNAPSVISSLILDTLARR